jgi:hypothetical protein
MTEKQIEIAIQEAVKALLADQPDIFELTEASRETEWNLASHLACKLAPFFDKYRYDLELLKPEAGNRRPDIVIHKRGTFESDLLVLEVKRDNFKGTLADKEKIERYWFAQPYLYQFGAVVNLNSDCTYFVEVLVNRNHPANAQ